VERLNLTMRRSYRTNRDGRTIWIVDAHREGKRFIVRADEKLTAFMELQGAIHELAVSAANREGINQGSAWTAATRHGWPEPRYFK
jgi:hypothetical protein